MNDLTGQAAEIRRHHDAVHAAALTAMEHALAAGRLLAEVKAALPHGEFESWLKANCPFTARTARRYMQLGPAISRINALLPSPEDDDGGRRGASRNWSFFHTPNAFLYRETARAIANALTGEHQVAIDVLTFVEARLIARRRAQGQFQYLLACTGTAARRLRFVRCAPVAGAYCGRAPSPDALRHDGGHRRLRVPERHAVAGPVARRG